MTDLLGIFRAGFTRRWHTNPDLAHTCDRIDGHAGRVARIILALHPDPTRRLLRAALIHDDGESVVGDMKAPLKDADPDLAARLAAVEEEAAVALWGDRVTLTESEALWLRWADRLDAFMWAAHHAPHALSGDGWPQARLWISNTADALDPSGAMGQRIDYLTREIGARA